MSLRRFIRRRAVWIAAGVIVLTYGLAIGITITRPARENRFITQAHQKAEEWVRPAPPVSVTKVSYPIIIRISDTEAKEYKFTGGISRSAEPSPPAEPSPLNQLIERAQSAAKRLGMSGATETESDR